jgi:hypothetical protein
MVKRLTKRKVSEMLNKAMATLPENASINSAVSLERRENPNDSDLGTPRR